AAGHGPEFVSDVGGSGFHEHRAVIGIVAHDAAGNGRAKAGNARAARAVYHVRKTVPHRLVDVRAADVIVVAHSHDKVRLEIRGDQIGHVALAGIIDAVITNDGEADIGATDVRAESESAEQKSSSDLPCQPFLHFPSGVLLRATG